MVGYSLGIVSIVIWVSLKNYQESKAELLVGFRQKKNATSPGSKDRGEPEVIMLGSKSLVTLQFLFPELVSR